MERAIGIMLLGFLVSSIISLGFMGLVWMLAERPLVVGFILLAIFVGAGLVSGWIDRDKMGIKK